MPGISPRLAAIVAALPIEPHHRVLEIGCGPGVAARAVAARLTTGHVLDVDRSAKAIAQTAAGSSAEIAAGRLSTRETAAEDFVLLDGEEEFDLVFAVRVGGFDGRHPNAGRTALQQLAAATRPGARFFVDGGQPLRELTIPRR